MLKLQLSKDLRKSLLQGHPWIYKQALISPESGGDKAQICQILDKKKQALAWGLYSPNSPLSVRVLFLGKACPKPNIWRERLQRAYQWRHQHLDKTRTQAYRLLNGEGDLLPGLVCDVYGPQVAVVQFDGSDCRDFWLKEGEAGHLWEDIQKLTGVEHIYFKPRLSAKEEGSFLGESPGFDEVLSQENGHTFVIPFCSGQKTGFFLDQRPNRAYLSSFVKGKRVLNLFSYTGGFSVYAGQGGAQSVQSVDISPQAIALCQRNWELNDLKASNHQGLCQDVFDFLGQEKDLWDVVVVDPPSMASSEKAREGAIKAYSKIFSQAAQRVRPHGHLCLSSCSSHVSFQDFFEIIEQSLSQSRCKGRILRVSGQGEDHPFPHACRELRYLKFVHLQLD